MGCYKRKRDQGDETKPWRIQYYDEYGNRKDISSGTKDQSEALAMVAKLQRKAKRFQAAGMSSIEAKVHRAMAQPIANHVDDYIADLESRGVTAKHIGTERKQLERIIEAIGAKTLSDLDSHRVQVALSKMVFRHVHKGDTNQQLSARSKNKHRTCVMSFTKWLHANHRTEVDLLSAVRPYDEASDKRHERRELTADEITHLLYTVEHADYEPRGLDKPTRAMAYRVSLCTGLRATELRALTVKAFKFTGDEVSILLPRRNANKQKGGTHPVPLELAPMLRDFLRGRDPDALPFAGLPVHSARMIREDLERARAAWIADSDEGSEERARREESDFLAYVNHDGMYADWHAQRTTYISAIVASGTDAKTAQSLARHTTSRMTMDRYAKAREGNCSAALESVDAFKAATDAQQKRSKTISKDRQTLSKTPLKDVGEISRKSHKVPQFTGKNERGDGGSRTHDVGFAIRCLSLLATSPLTFTQGRKCEAISQAVSTITILPGIRVVLSDC